MENSSRKAANRPAFAMGGGEARYQIRVACGSGRVHTVLVKIENCSKYKVLPSSSELHDTGCKERKLRNIKIKTKMIGKKLNRY